MPERKKLNLSQVEKLIEEFQANNPKPSAAALLAFAEQINGSSFCKPKSPKIKPLSMAKAKAAVLEKFGCKSVTDLRKNKTLQMAFLGEQINLKTTEDWRSQYRKWIGVPADERNKTGPHCINGIDVFENFRPCQCTRPSFNLNAIAQHPLRTGLEGSSPLLIDNRV